jgi:hypothetical protein
MVIRDPLKGVGQAQDAPLFKVWRKQLPAHG